MRINIEDARKNDLLKEMFFEQNLKLVYLVAHEYNNVLDFDERVSIGQFGLMKAFNTFNSELGFAWSTYAKRVIINEIIMEYRKACYRRRYSSLETVLAKSEIPGEEDLKLEHVIAAPEDEYNSFDYQAIEEVYKRFVKIYSKKEPKLIQIFDMFILHNITTKEIASKFGYTQPQGSKLAKKAIRAIQEIAIEMDVIDDFNAYAKRDKNGEKQRIKNRDNGIKRKALYVLLNYPELTSNEIGKIINWSSMKIGLLKRSYDKGTFTLSPDESVKEKVEEYLANKKLYA